MECNKDEAARAKEIAERKFTAKDLMGAKKFALKAQTLFPGLEGIPQMLATLDVHIAAENKINGEADWYGILGADPKADDEAVKKQYRKLALMLHPDKNKSVGADGAFKLLSEAWSLLSDKSKRVAYDQKRRVHQRVATASGSSQAPPGANGFYNFTKGATSVAQTQKVNTQTQKSTTQTQKSTSHNQKGTSRAGRSSAPASSQKPRPNTFWTVCHKCKMQYEYLRIYLNHNLLCPNCHEPFLAAEIAPPPTNGAKSAPPKHETADRMGVGSAGFSGNQSYNQNNFQWGPFSKASGASTAAQAASVVSQAYEKAKREREQAQAALKREELRRKHQASKNAAKRRRGMEDVGVSSYGRDVTNQMGVGAGAGGAGTTYFSGSNGNARPSITRDISQIEIQSLLRDKARKEILKKLNESTVSKTAAKETGNGNEREKSLGNIDVHNNQKQSGEPVDTKNGSSDMKGSGISGVRSDAETLTINVPDSDFHDFDKDRSEKCFEDNQVWAAYDNDDGMPRFYALVQKVISVDPFTVRISWLNSKTNSELGPLNWVSSGFSKTCGEFRIGKYEVSNSLNSFSHRVRSTKGPRGTIWIYPRKGDVWALYRNWSPDWNELTADNVIHKYDMIEVVEDFSEDQGVLVTPLVKVAGFKTVFHRHLDPRETRRIPREELFRFSHQIPSSLITGQEAANAPKGCRELDPAATPLELLKVINDLKEEDTMEVDKKCQQVDVADDGENDPGIEIAANSIPVTEEAKGS
ncbi:uncharacterized protein LOC126596867 [Malus sylvestris]|uniref:uncharacterized protein LOC126596867 n=1 Tax=Malus sylvestris TaxID=3752 RepID=UPI0021AC5BB9|nr:uncharacterized protein LOC126596867 [Malus sylvestris]XP_050119495.1 uncharacterized protein LOC126596867 [Malus sylvestris]